MEVVYPTIQELVANLRKHLEFRDFDIPVEDSFILEDEIKRAINEINRCRRFDATEEKPYDKKYENMIIPLSITAFSKIGAEGQSSHNENGVQRTYTNGGDYPADMLDSIIPLIK